jgi:hypothetical protein
MHRDEFVKQKVLVNKMFTEAKTEYLSTLVAENAHNPKYLFRTLDYLLHKPTSSPLPQYSSPVNMANDFARFFDQKVQKVQEELGTTVDVHCLEEIPKYQTELTTFQKVTPDEVHKLINVSKDKSCALDPIPTWIIKKCSNVIVPIICSIINGSFQESFVPKQLKFAIIFPVLKKVILELIFKNYRPISNLPYVSKLMEKAVCSRLMSHCELNSLLEVFQSAYRLGHSTETALLKVHNDILLSIDKKQVVCLILLDLSAAFDTVNHAILLHRLEHRFGVTNDALSWFKSYLSDRQQAVVIEGQQSDPFPMSCGIPQGSVLGPVLFSLYTAPLGDVVRKYGVDFHLYADDTQIYMALEPGSHSSQTVLLSTLQACIHDIAIWMHINKLKLNNDKTEVMLLGTKQQLSKISLSTFPIMDVDVPVTKEVRNLGVLMDSNMSLSSHVSTLTKAAYYHLRNIGQIRKFLDTSSAEKAVHAFVTSRLDCCNALLYGTTKANLGKLQKVQNAAARLILNRRKFDSATPLLRQLHWLPVQSRIKYKLLLLTFKCVHGLAPSYLSEQISTRSCVRTTRSSNTISLMVPRTSMKSAGDRAFAAAAPHLWNALPADIRSTTKLESFKSRLKTHLLKSAIDIP